MPSLADIPDPFLGPDARPEFLRWVANTVQDLTTAKQLLRLWRLRNQQHFTASEWLAVKAAIEAKTV